MSRSFGHPAAIGTPVSAAGNVARESVTPVDFGACFEGFVDVDATIEASTSTTVVRSDIGLLSANVDSAATVMSNSIAQLTRDFEAYHCRMAARHPMSCECISSEFWEFGRRSVGRTIQGVLHGNGEKGGVVEFYQQALSGVLWGEAPRVDVLNALVTKTRETDIGVQLHLLLSVQAALNPDRGEHPEPAPLIVYSGPEGAVVGAEHDGSVYDRRGSYFSFGPGAAALIDVSVDLGRPNPRIVSLMRLSSAAFLQEVQALSNRDLLVPGLGDGCRPWCYEVVRRAVTVALGDAVELAAQDLQISHIGIDSISPGFVAPWSASAATTTRAAWGHLPGASPIARLSVTEASTERVIPVVLLIDRQTGLVAYDIPSARGYGPNPLF